MRTSADDVVVELTAMLTRLGVLSSEPPAGSDAERVDRIALCCRDPFCDAPIRQIDHIHRHRADGPTSLVNWRGVCARGTTSARRPAGGSSSSTTVSAASPPPRRVFLSHAAELRPVLGGLGALPIAVWEFSLGVYLTAKGFRGSGRAPRLDARPHAYS